MPKRLTRSRRKGSKLPANSRYVGRPTLFGNPFAMPRFGHAKALKRLRERVLTNLHRLDGYDLACWCPQTSLWCHANTLLKMAPEYAEFNRLAA
jgi:Domain of unknown function (DUF4326)